MAETERRPVLGPVLTLKKNPLSKDPNAGGKNRESINQSRLQKQRGVLSKQIELIHETYQNQQTGRLHAGRLPLVVDMFDDKLAPSWKPQDLFSLANAQLIAPWPSGYLVEAEIDRLPLLAKATRDSGNVATQVDIGNIEAISEHSQNEVFRDKATKRIWKSAIKVDGGRLFHLAFMPFKDIDARNSVVDHLRELSEENIFSPTDIRKREITLAKHDDRNSSLAEGFRQYLRNDFGQTSYVRASIVVPNKTALRNLALSGSALRINPVRPVSATTPPGSGKEPDPEVPATTDNDPIVGLIDGGMTARRYETALAWRHKHYIEKVAEADTSHGNQVASLAVHGYAWNNHLQLPELNCRIGIAQAIAKRGHHANVAAEAFIIYLENLFRSHPEVKVWNLSFNEDICCEQDEMSQLGHDIATLARKHRILPVISAGNRRTDQPPRIFPPADCEAALTVAGRKHTAQGEPGEDCDISCTGPGPELLRKPEISWFSTLRTIGGSVSTATSWTAPIVSSLAAHTCHQLKNPDPDLVKALLINQCDLAEHTNSRGWGSPQIEHLPWECPNHQVTLAWSSELRPGQEYYWEDIPIPESLIKDGGLYGYGAMTAIVNPYGLVSGAMTNYFSCRLETTVQYKNRQGRNQSLLGSLDISKEKEEAARRDYDKWNPVRHHTRDFTKRSLSFSGQTMQVRARIYMRDNYQFNGYSTNADIPWVPVAFVLTLKSANPKDPMYNEMLNSLGNFVENATIKQDIDIDV